MRWTPPTAEDQILFLRRLQRLLNDGAFTSTYKYALLHALADLAVVRGDDSGAPLELTTREIAETMIGLAPGRALPGAGRRTPPAAEHER